MTELGIDRVGVERIGEVLDLVEGLLDELGEEREDCPALDRDQLQREWEARGSGSIVLGAQLRGKLIGVVTLTESFAFYANGAYGTIDEMIVLPPHRNEGVGERLIEAAARLGRGRGWSRLAVTAPESERWARTRRFYERCGFEFAGPKLKLSLEE